MNPGARSLNNELVDLALVGLVVIFGFGLALGAAGDVAAVLAGEPRPPVGIASGLRILADPRHPGVALGIPDLPASAYWPVVAAMLTLLGGAAWAVWGVIARLRHHSANDPGKIQGIATRRDIDLVASKRTLVRRGETLRPSISHPRAEDVSYLLGHSCGREIWASV
jgi:hypothetical protein